MVSFLSSPMLDPRGRTDAAECVGGPFDGDRRPVRNAVRIAGPAHNHQGVYWLVDGRTPSDPWVFRYAPPDA